MCSDAHSITLRYLQKKFIFQIQSCLNPYAEYSILFSKMDFFTSNKKEMKTKSLSLINLLGINCHCSTIPKPLNVNNGTQCMTEKSLVLMYTLLQSVIMCYIWHTWLLWSIGFSSDLRFSPSVAYSTCNIIRQNSWESCKIWKKTNQPYTFYYELTILYNIYI